MNIFNPSNPPAKSVLIKTAKTKQEVVDIILNALKKKNFIGKQNGNTIAGVFNASNLLTGTFSLTVNDRSGGFAVDSIVKIQYSGVYYITLGIISIVGVVVSVILIFLFCIGFFFGLAATWFAQFMLAKVAGAANVGAHKYYEDALENAKQEVEMTESMGAPNLAALSSGKDQLNPVRYHYSEDGNVKGPVSRKELDTLIQEKKLTSQVFILEDGTKDWIKYEVLVARNAPPPLANISVPPPPDALPDHGSKHIAPPIPPGPPKP
jgi:hypothetical protein